MLATELGNDGIVKMLADHDADMSIQDNEGRGESCQWRNLDLTDQ